MRRSELSDDLATWTVPGGRTKNHRVHVVPLPPLARDIIKPVDAHGDLVFTTNGRTSVSGFSKMKSRLDAKLKIAPWRIHDLRRTAATGMAEIGVAPHIVEAVPQSRSAVPRPVSLERTTGRHTSRRRRPRSSDGPITSRGSSRGNGQDRRYSSREEADVTRKYRIDYEALTRELPLSRSALEGSCVWNEGDAICRRGGRPATSESGWMRRDWANHESISWPDGKSADLEAEPAEDREATLRLAVQPRPRDHRPPSTVTSSR